MYDELTPVDIQKMKDATNLLPQRQMEVICLTM